MSAVAALVTLFGLLRWGSDPEKHFRWLAVLWVFWVLVPPIWFLIEWAAFDCDPATKGCLDHMRSFEDLQYSQELASKVWIAGSLVLGALLKKEVDAGRKWSG